MKVLVIDDHALVRDALRGVLRTVFGASRVAEAASWREAQRELRRPEGFELVLLDLGLPDRDGFEALLELRERHPECPVVVLSGQQDQASVSRALELGAVGYIPKSASRKVMLSALQLVISGGMYLPPELLGGVRTAREQLASAPPSPPEESDSGSARGLTARQMDVLALLMQGKSNKLICRQLGLAEPTVKNHVSAILRVLNASNRTEAVVAARALGIAPRRRSS